MNWSFLTRALFALAACGTPALSVARDLPHSIYEAEYGWEQESTRDSCAVRREFGSGSDVVLLALRQYFPSNTLRTTVAASKLENAKERALPLHPKIWLYPAELEIEPRAYFRITSAAGPSGLLFTLPALQNVDQENVQQGSDPYEDLRKSDLLVLEDVFAHDVGLAIGRMDEAMDFMANCTKELVAGWGLDPEEQRKRAKAPELMDPERVTRQVAQEFPAGPLTRDQPGRVNLRLIVDERGEPSDCFVEPPVLPEYRETACKQILKYARFKPALDADGQPIASYFVTSIIYVIN